MAVLRRLRRIGGVTRLSPRSARDAAAGGGVGLSAAGVWRLLPVVPRAIWTVSKPRGSSLTGAATNRSCGTLRFYSVDTFLPTTARAGRPHSEFRRRGRVAAASDPPDSTKWPESSAPPFPDSPPDTGFEAISRDPPGVGRVHEHRWHVA